MSESMVLSIGAWGLFDHLYKIKKYPDEGETIELDMSSDEFHQSYFGDCSINIAVIVASLGLKSSLATVVGYDFFDSGYASYLKEKNVEISNVSIVENHKSGHNLIFFDNQGDGFCFTHLGAARYQDEYQVSKDIIASSSVVIVSEKFSNYTLNAIQRARKLGKTTVINGMLGSSDNIEDFLQSTDILFINKSELRNVLEYFKAVDVSIVFSFGVKQIFVTEGKKGGSCYSKEDSSHFDIVPTNNRKDTTGAGDSFVAGTITALIKGYSPNQAAKIGATVSSFIIEKWGCQTNVPSWDQVIARYENFTKRGQEE